VSSKVSYGNLIFLWYLEVGPCERIRITEGTHGASLMIKGERPRDTHRYLHSSSLMYDALSSLGNLPARLSPDASLSLKKIFFSLQRFSATGLSFQ
jgi:hypothetical protein